MPNELIENQDFRDTFRVPKNILDASFSPAVYAARDAIKKRVGTVAYEDAIKLDGETANPARRNALRLAALYLAYAYAIPILNPRVTESGLLIESKSDNDSTERAISPKEMEQLVDKMRQQADELIEPYSVIADGVSATKAGTVGVIDPLGIDANASAALRGILPCSNSRLPLI